MTHSSTWRVMTYTLAVFFMAIFALILPRTALADNTAPAITSEPPTAISADNLYQYAVTASDSNNDSIALSLTTAPSGMTLQNNIITWQPTRDGIYNVVLQATDGHNGFDNQSWQITVSLGAASTLVITPNDKPTIVGLNNSKQFSAEAFDRYDNILNDTEITWSTPDEYGSIDQQGMFTAKKGGITSVIAASGQAEAQIGVIVEDTRVNQNDSNANTATADTETNTNTETATNSNTNSQEAEVENIQEDESLLEGSPLTAEAMPEETDKDEPCSNFSTFIVWLILIIYILSLFAYYKFERKNKSASWWIFPLLLTVIGLIIYYKNFCSGTFMWWPWILVISGLVITGYYRRRRKSNFSDNSQTELPF